MIKFVIWNGYQRTVKEFASHDEALTYVQNYSDHSEYVGFGCLSDKPKKIIKVNLIDTGGHGYMSVSKKDFTLVMGGKEDQITGFSGMNCTRVYLEEDQDASTFLRQAECSGFQVNDNVESSYNPSFSCRHNYDAEMVYCNFKDGDVVIFYNDDEATIQNLNGKIYAKTKSGDRYKIPKTNPFKYIKGYKK